MTSKQQIVKIPKGYLLQVSSSGKAGAYPQSSEIKAALKSVGFTDYQTLEQATQSVLVKWEVEKPR